MQKELDNSKMLVFPGISDTPILQEQSQEDTETEQVELLTLKLKLSTIEMIRLLLSFSALLVSVYLGYCLFVHKSEILITGCLILAILQSAHSYFTNILYKYVSNKTPHQENGQVNPMRGKGLSL